MMSEPLTRKVNGVTVAIPAAERGAIKAEWHANSQRRAVDQAAERAKREDVTDNPDMRTIRAAIMVLAAEAGLSPAQFRAAVRAHMQGQ